MAARSEPLCGTNVPHLNLGSDMTDVTEADGFQGHTMLDRDGDARA